MNLEYQDLEVCIDQTLPPELMGRAAELALKENPENASDGKALQQVAAMGAGDIPVTAVAMVGKRWSTGRTLRIAFFDDPRSTPKLRERIRFYANQWTQYANLKFAWGVPLQQADIRISVRPGGTWSQIGTNALVIPKHQPTMNFGWLTEDNVDEKPRSIWHEFGHGAIGLGHEHQHPSSDISWNRAVVIDYYTSPPNNWTKERVESQIFGAYSVPQSNAGRYDQDSIMHYAIPARFVHDPADAVEPNPEISPRDKIFAGRLYPFPKDKP